MRYNYFLVLLFAAVLMAPAAMAQVGGKSNFEFLNNYWHARLGGIGGKNVSTRDADPNMALSNPALLSNLSSQHFSFSHAPGFAGINSQLFSGAWSLDSNTHFGAAIGGTSYGNMQAFDLGGNAMGTTNANDFLAQVTIAKSSGPFTVGGSLKFVNSNIAEFAQRGLAVDAGASFKHPTRDFVVGLAVRNVGLAWDNYEAAQRPTLPLDIMLGMSYRLEHLPLRFSITSHRLDRWDIAYVDPSNSRQLDEQGNPIPPKKTFGDILMRHFVFGGEFFLGKRITVRAGYNHLVNRELRLENYRGAPGFSFGLGVKINAFEVSYSRAVFHAAGGMNFLTLTMGLPRFKQNFTRVETPANDGLPFAN